MRRKAADVQHDWEAASDRNVAFEDALVGVLAQYYFRTHIPRVIVRYSEGETDEGLQRVFDKIVGVMRTPTFATINYVSPRSVEAAERLCFSHLIAERDSTQRDARTVLRELVGYRPVVYWDQGRELPEHYNGMLEKLNIQFGNQRVGLALKHHEEFAYLVERSDRIASDWKRGSSSRERRIETDDRGRVMEIGAQFASFVSERAAYGVNLYHAVREFWTQMKRDEIPYQQAQYRLRGIPFAIGENTF